MNSSTVPTSVEDSRQEGQPLSESLNLTEDKDEDKRTFGKLLQETFPTVYARRGLLWLSVAIFFQAAQITTMADLSKEIGATEALFFRSVSLFVTVVGISWGKSESYNLSDMLLFILSSVCDVVFIYGTILASHFIWIGDITSISMNQQIPSSILASLLLGEALNILDVVFVVLNATGVLLVSQPSFLFSNPQEFGSSSESALPGFLLAFISLMGTIGNVLLYRTLVHRKTEDPYLLPVLTGMTGLLVSSCVCSITSSWQFPESSEGWSMVIFLGVFTVLTFVPITKSLQTENVKTVTVMLTLVIPLTTLYDFIALERQPNWAKISGVLLILASSFGIHMKTTWTES